MIEAARLPELLRAEGLVVLETEGWLTRVAPGPFSPVAVLNHHTAAKGYDRDAPSLEICKRGRGRPGQPGYLPGPLCNVLIGRSAACYLTSGGRANDSGRGVRAVLDRVRQGLPPLGDATTRGDVDGNAWFWDVEVENDGIGEEYPEAQLEALIAVDAVICRESGWTADHVLHHREWTSRKRDMSWRGDLRGAVASRLSASSRKELPTMVIYKEKGGDRCWLMFGKEHRYILQDEFDGLVSAGVPVVELPEHVIARTIDVPVDDTTGNVRGR